MPIRITGMNSGLDTESIISELVSAQETKKNSLVKAQTKLSWKMDAWKTLNSKVYGLYSSTLSDMRFSSAYTQKKTTVSDSSVASVIAGTEATDGVQTLKINGLAKSGYLTGAQLSGVTSGSKLSDLAGIGEDETVNLKVKLGDGTSKDISLSGSSKVSDVVKQLKDAGVNASFDEKNQRFFVSAKETGLAADFALTAQDAEGNTTDSGLKVLSSLGLLTAEADANVSKDGKVSAQFQAQLDSLGLTLSTDKAEGGATRIKGQDAEIILNGAKFTSSSNNFNINGLTITALKESAEEISLTTTNDYDGIYDTIKKFLKGYNELVNEMDKLYNAASSKGYEPLTSEEKDAMSESEIEDWEKKIKDSLLRRDATVNDLSNTLHDIMTSGFEVKGKTYYLSSFGINTLGYFTSAENEKHAFHIDGDKDDSSTSNNADRLKSMITNEPEVVMDFFQQLTNQLYTKLTDKMSANESRSIYKAYNDKQMKEEYDSYAEKIKDQEARVTALEDKWYAKFSAMETALAKLNSKTSAISGMLGM
ncbi:MAG: flagellar filament capping protein FliD [Lachnospiraceae bacterium]|nr:flagellar filament capping protein FliD [Lachnospiraceae bacterium]